MINRLLFVPVKRKIKTERSHFDLISLEWLRNIMKNGVYAD